MGAKGGAWVMRGQGTSAESRYQPVDYWQPSRCRGGSRPQERKQNGLISSRVAGVRRSPAYSLSLERERLFRGLAAFREEPVELVQRRAVSLTAQPATSWRNRTTSVARSS